MTTAPPPGNASRDLRDLSFCEVILHVKAEGKEYPASSSSSCTVLATGRDIISVASPDAGFVIKIRLVGQVEMQTG